MHGLPVHESNQKSLTIAGITSASGSNSTHATVADTGASLRRRHPLSQGVEDGTSGGLHNRPEEDACAKCHNPFGGTTTVCTTAELEGACIANP